MGNIKDLLLTNDEDLMCCTTNHTAHIFLQIMFQLMITTAKASCRIPGVVFDYLKANWKGLCNHRLVEDLYASVMSWRMQ